MADDLIQQKVDQFNALAGQNANGDTVNYAGKQLPRDQVKYVKPPLDLTNNPSAISVFNGFYQITLPPDTKIIGPNGRKLLAKSQIIDGVVVYERILRDPYSIEFEGVMRAKDVRNNNIFPQLAFEDLWNYVWLPDTVLTITNTYLNGLGIREIVVEEISPITVLGSTNLPFKIRCYENVPGQSLIIA